MYVSGYVHVHTGAHPIQKRMLDALEMGLFTGGCEPIDVSAENPIGAFCKSSMLS